jgi:hypothetical protein
MTDHGEAELSDRIDALAVESQFGEGNRRFIPEGCLETIITREAIEQVLREAYEDSDDGDPAQHQALVAFIHERAIKLFAIALSINLEDATLYNGMKLLHQNNFTDDNLPIKPWNDDHEFSKLDAKFWNRRKIRLFHQGQAEFLAPVLTVATKRQSNHDFSRDHIMPFVEKSNDGFDKGSFGQVYQYRIHPNHLKDPEGLLTDPENPVGNRSCSFGQGLYQQLTAHIRSNYGMDLWQSKKSNPTRKIGRK